jgi:hypothetical protein
MEHVIAEKHGGATAADNLAYACAFCNRAKGSDIGSITSRTGQLVRLFNPRTDRWSEHFQLELDQMTIRALTDIGEVTVRLLELNHADRILERFALSAVKRYPTSQAHARMAS